MVSHATVTLSLLALLVIILSNYELLWSKLQNAQNVTSHLMNLRVAWHPLKFKTSMSFLMHSPQLMKTSLNLSRHVAMQESSLLSTCSGNNFPMSTFSKLLCQTSSTNCIKDSSNTFSVGLHRHVDQLRLMLSVEDHLQTIKSVYL
jgi:uncharacterized membrane protein YqhA